MTGAGFKAEELLKDLGLSNLPVRPDKVCRAISSETYRVEIERRAIGSEGFQGMAIGDERHAVVVVNSDISNNRRRRFTIAHEVGHVCLHLQTGMESRFRCSERDISSGNDDNRQYEREANEFASALLMPSFAVSSMIRRDGISWALAGEVKQQCEVSLEAAARRVVALSDEPCCLLIHKDGRMWNPIKSCKFRMYVPGQPPPVDMPESPDDGQASLPSDMDECGFDDWGISSHAAGCRLLCSTISSAKYGRKMTLLLIDENAEIDEEEARF